MNRGFMAAQKAFDKCDFDCKLTSQANTESVGYG